MKIEVRYEILMLAVATLVNFYASFWLGLLSLAGTGAIWYFKGREKNKR